MNILEKLDWVEEMYTGCLDDDLEYAMTTRDALCYYILDITKALLDVAHTLDPVVQEVQNKLVTRSRVGMEKYGVTMSGAKLDAQGWINHTVEELLDAANYLTRLKQELK